MADEKKGKTAQAGSAAPKTSDFDLASLLPEGYDAKDFYATGGLTPLYLPKYALAEGFPPVAGFLDRVHFLPTLKQGTGRQEREWTPCNLLVKRLRIATKGVRRVDMNTQKTVDVEAGGRISIPITGQLCVNQDLLDALRDLEHVYFIVARCVGTRKVNNMPSEMTEWEILMPKTKLERRATMTDFLLPPWYVQAVANNSLHASIDEGKLVGSLAEGETSTGQKYDGTTGELISPNAAS